MVAQQPKQKVCIANRGEIALRIGRACKKLGYATFQIYSEADRDTFFVSQADEAQCIGAAPAAESYLHIQNIVQAALQAGCAAVHPGYGFLSENADFAVAVQKAGMIFIGPEPETIRLLGNKTEARNIVLAQGVSVAPGVVAGLSDEELLSEAQKVGFPLILKAVAGGGGRGMRVVYSIDEMQAALPRVRAEAEKFFSNADVYFERYIENPRHVEVQLFGDGTGKVLHFGTRECSLQRRHQKIVEEAPAVFLSEEQRQEIQREAVAAAASVKYRNAGTAEFLVDAHGHYFLEINTRIQVEHPVTEMICGIDLLSLQIETAFGASLDLEQKDIQTTGHAIECRVYAEDVLNGFAPARGSLQKVHSQEFPFFREDRGFFEDDTISFFYDALLTKLIVYGDSRDDAIAKMRQVLAQYQIEGVKNSLPFHRWLFIQSAFVKDQFDIAFLDTIFSNQDLDLVERVWDSL